MIALLRQRQIRGFFGAPLDVNVGLVGLQPRDDRLKTRFVGLGFAHQTRADIGDPNRGIRNRPAAGISNCAQSRPLQHLGGCRLQQPNTRDKNRQTNPTDSQFHGKRPWVGKATMEYY